MVFDAGEVTVADFSRLRTRHPYIAMVPQWHLLTTLAEAAQREPGFRLVRNAEVEAPLVEDGRVVGVRWADRTAEGETHDLAADLVIACDGRDSTLRSASGLPVREFDVPVDSWWFRLPHLPHDRNAGGSIRRSGRRLVVMLDRGDFYRMNYLIPRGTDSAPRAGLITDLHVHLTDLHPWLGDRVSHISSWDDVKLLQVRMNRLRRWSRPGLLCIGDAAHAMSPIGGIGITLAVQDAVATARCLAGPLSAGRLEPTTIDRAARRVHRRREWPTAVTQGLQRFMHRQDPNGADDPAPSTLPPPLRLLGRFPSLRRGPARLLGIGVRPERVPSWARSAESFPGADWTAHGRSGATGRATRTAALAHQGEGTARPLRNGPFRLSASPNPVPRVDHSETRITQKKADVGRVDDLVRGGGLAVDFQSLQLEHVVHADLLTGLG